MTRSERDTIVVPLDEARKRPRQPSRNRRKRAVPIFLILQDCEEPTEQLLKFHPVFRHLAE